jgi:hypothetical protein
MNDQNINLELELAIAEKQAQEAELQHKATLQKLEQLKIEQERRLNDPKERAKMFKTANDMFDSGVKEYEAKGYICDVQRDENGLLIKITFKTGKSAKSGNRGPRKMAGQEGYIPAMTRQQFAKIYSSLGQNFNNQDIISKLVASFGEGKYSKFRAQPVLGEILANGLDGIKIEKIGNKGKNVSYNKLS